MISNRSNESKHSIIKHAILSIEHNDIYHVVYALYTYIVFYHSITDYLKLYIENRYKLQTPICNTHITQLRIDDIKIVRERCHECRGYETNKVFAIWYMYQLNSKYDSIPGCSRYWMLCHDCILSIFKLSS
jgi:hypothetical protein